MNNTESAGLAVAQAMNHQYHLERAVSQGKQVLRLVLYTSDYDVPPYFPGFTTGRNLDGLRWSEARRSKIGLLCGLTAAQGSKYDI